MDKLTVLNTCTTDRTGVYEGKVFFSLCSVACSIHATNRQTEHLIVIQARWFDLLSHWQLVDFDGFKAAEVLVISDDKQFLLVAAAHVSAYENCNPILDFLRPT